MNDAFSEGKRAVEGLVSRWAASDDIRHRLNALEQQIDHLERDMSLVRSHIEKILRRQAGKE